PQLRAVDHHPDPRDPPAAAPPGLQADPVHAGHANPAASDQAAPAKVQGEQAEAQRGDDEAVPGAGGQPARRLLAHAPADPGAHRPVLGAAVPAASPTPPGAEPSGPDHQRGGERSPRLQPGALPRDEPALQRPGGGYD